MSSHGPTAVKVDAFEKEEQWAFANAAYSLANIRTSEKDPNTAAVRCVADLQVRLPKNWGTSSSEVQFKEELTTDNKLYVTVLEQ